MDMMTAFGGLLIVIIVFCVLLCGLVALVVLLRTLGGQSRGRGTAAEETRLIQELHQGMEKLEKRIESLETLIIEQEADHKESKS